MLAPPLANEGLTGPQRSGMAAIPDWQTPKCQRITAERPQETHLDIFKSYQSLVGSFVCAAYSYFFPSLHRSLPSKSASRSEETEEEATWRDAPRPPAFDHAHWRPATPSAEEPAWSTSEVNMISWNRAKSRVTGIYCRFSFQINMQLILLQLQITDV